MPTSTAPWQPFWRTGRVHGETLLFVDAPPGESAAGSLLLTPRSPLIVTSATGEVTYAEPDDYLAVAASRQLLRPPASRMPITRHDELYPAHDPDGSGFMHVRGNPARFLLTAEDDTFHRRQVAVSYACDPAEWTGYVPAFAGAALPRTLARLRGGRATLALAGDSISAGYNASGFIGAPPHQPAYGPLLAAGLEDAYGAVVELRNVSTAGWTSDDGLGVGEEMAADAPDLALIAFGMNDAGYADPVDYVRNIRLLMESVRGRSPLTEFVLVSPMLPHPDWHYPALERFAGYREGLASLCGPGVALADVTALWSGVLARKSPYDLTGNGINHPNDFGHRLYAQTIWSLLVAGLPANCGIA